VRFVCHESFIGGLLACETFEGVCGPTLDLGRVDPDRRRISARITGQTTAGLTQRPVQIKLAYGR
jgi:hypothetical protein